MELLRKLIRFSRKTPRQKLRVIRYKVLGTFLETDWYWKVHSPGNHRTTYIIGLFGTGRIYINHIMQQHIGKRAKYFRNTIRLHQGRTSMIYSGHATIKYASRAQALPAVTRRILEDVRAGFADLIFLYRHPLDSLVTDWVYWRTYLRNETGLYVALAYKDIDDLCADLEKNFVEFESFAEGDPAFFAASPGLPFLSFREFVEETELYIPSATLTLRFEDFAINPSGEFSKIAKVMSLDLDMSRVHVAPPKTAPYRFLAIQEKVPRFRDFINGLDAETKRRIEKIGYKSGLG